MKGTLFSTDFLKDSEDNLRLLEINTDTTIHETAIPLLDFSGFKTLLEDNAITKVAVIFKVFQIAIVDELETYLTDNYSAMVSFDRQFEEGNSIYPSAIEDADDKFILRLAYDESALLDSEYAKNTHNVLKLFADNDQINNTVGYYFSGSEGVEDHITRTFNDSNVPDILVKNTTTTLGEPIEFFKFGQSGSSAEERYNALFEVLEPNKVVMNFYNDTATTRVESYRTLHIVYGTDLEILPIASFKTSAILQKPSTLPVVDANIITKAPVEHYHEFTTTLPRFGVGSNYGGVFEEENIVKADGTLVSIKSASVNDTFKSYFISGSPDTDNQYEYSLWSYPGSELPSGSYPTTSSLINNLEVDLFYNMVFNVTTGDGSAFRATGNTHLLVYVIDEDMLKYVPVSDITSTEHQLVSAGSGLVDVTSNVCEILSGEYTSHILDMEEADTFFLGDGNLSVKIIAHNCFPAGTTITMADGSYKVIEEIQAGDKVLTYNQDTKLQEEGLVGGNSIKKDNILFRIKLKDNTLIKSTPLHKFYVVDKGWVSAQELKSGDKVLTDNKAEIEIYEIKQLTEEVTVYHISDVKDNHTYYANGILVHNYKSGQK